MSSRKYGGGQGNVNSSSNRKPGVVPILPMSRIREETIWTDRVTEEGRRQREWEGKWGFMKDTSTYRTTSAGGSKEHVKTVSKAWNPYNSHIFISPGCIPTSSLSTYTSSDSTGGEFDATPPSTYARSYNTANSTTNHHTAPSTQRLTTTQKTKNNAKITSTTPLYTDRVPMVITPVGGGPHLRDHPMPAHLSNKRHTATLSTYAFNVRNAAAIKKYREKQANISVPMSSTRDFHMDDNVDVVTVHNYPATSNMEYGFKFKPQDALQRNDALAVCAVDSFGSTNIISSSTLAVPKGRPITSQTTSNSRNNTMSPHALVNSLERFGNVTSNHTREALRKFNAQTAKTL